MKFQFSGMRTSGMLMSGLSFINFHEKFVFRLCCHEDYPIIIRVVDGCRHVFERFWGLYWLNGK